MTPAELKVAREKAGLKQAELAAMIGRNERQIRRYEDGEAPIKGAVEIALTAVLGQAALGKAGAKSPRKPLKKAS